jgi:hypothetical protein
MSYYPTRGFGRLTFGCQLDMTVLDKMSMRFLVKDDIAALQVP